MYKDATIDLLINTYQQDYAKGLLTHEQLMGLVYRLDRISYSQSRGARTHGRI